MYFGSFCFRDELGFLNCDDNSMCMYLNLAVQVFVYCVRRIRTHLRYT